MSFPVYNLSPKGEVDLLTGCEDPKDGRLIEVDRFPHHLWHAQEGTKWFRDERSAYVAAADMSLAHAVNLRTQLAAVRARAQRQLDHLVALDERELDTCVTGSTRRQTSPTASEKPL